MELSWTLSPTHFKQRKIIYHTVLTARITEPSPIQGQWGWNGFLHIFTQANHTFHCPLLDFLLSCFCGKTPLCTGNLVGERQLCGHATPLCHIFPLSISQLTKRRVQNMACRHLNIWGGSPKGGKSLYCNSPGTIPAQYVLLNCFLSYTNLELIGKEKNQTTLYFCPHTKARQSSQFHAAFKSPDLRILNQLPPTQSRPPHLYEC